MPGKQNLRKAIEDRFADSVKRRVRLFWTSYRKSGGEMSRAAIVIDGREVLQMHDLIYCWEDTYHPPADRRTELGQRNIYSDWMFKYSLNEYLDLTIEKILHSENPIIRALGMLDARTGKRTLRKVECENENELVKRMYRLRCECEGIGDWAVSSDLTSKIKPQFTPRPRRIPAVEPGDVLSKSRISRDLRTLISHLQDGGLVRDDLDTEESREVFDAFSQSTDKDGFCADFNIVLSESKILDDRKLLKGAIAMLVDRSSWIRDIESWSPRTYNAERQFLSLLSHLYARYPVPVFMAQAWTTGNAVHQQWYRQLGIGKNIRTVEHLPVRFTKAMAHLFLSAPDHYSINGAIRWAQILAVGGDKRIADAICETRLRDTFVDDEFWLIVFRFFAANPMLDPARINPIVDYIWHEKYEDVIAFPEPGVAENLGPAQPNFTMRGRTVDSLLRQVERWHNQLGIATKDLSLEWQRTDVNNFHFVEGTRESKNMRVWRITELLSSKQLVEEGRQLRHCVASYAASCRSRAKSIWSMTVETENGVERLLTIEVTNREIRQVRGKRNRLAEPKEKEIIQRWSAMEKLEYIP